MGVGWRPIRVWTVVLERRAAVARLGCGLVSLTSRQIWVGDFVFDGEGLSGGVGIEALAEMIFRETVGEGEKLGDLFPFVAGRLMEGDAQQQFIVAAWSISVGH